MNLRGYITRLWKERPAGRLDRKLFVVFLFLIILPIGLITYFAAERYTATIENNTVAYVSQLSSKMMGKLDDYVTDMMKISIIPSYLNEIQSGLEMSNRHYQAEGQPKESASLNESELKLQITRKVERSIYFMNNIKEGTSNVYLFDLFGNPYYVVKSGGNRSNLQQYYDNWRKLATEAGGRPVLVSTQEIAVSAGSKQYMFTVVRDIIDKSYHSIGTIVVDANIGVIENIVTDLEETTHGTTFILDDNGTVIYDSEKKYLSRSMTDNAALAQATGNEGSFRHKVDGEEQLVVYRKSEQTGWLILITVPERQLMQDALKTRKITIAAAVGVTSFALIISLILIYALTRPLRSIVHLMKQVQTGKLDVVFPVRRRDEASLIGVSFNRMMARIKQLIDDIYAIEKRKKEAELERLQHQINPHFIYNTLETIRMTAVLHNDQEVGDMVQLLGQQLRYSIHAGSEVVEVKREWEHVKAYIELLNYRYGERFVLTLPDDPGADSIRVMKLLFQPIIENAVNHGFDENKTVLHLTITYAMDGMNHVFTVTDDGLGMSAEALARLRSMLDQAQPQGTDGRGVGLRNVHERLQLRYGRPYGLTVDSEEGRGTAVRITFPAEHVEEPRTGGLSNA
ncbi:sensor histidine kinase YesM [Paenibacillus lautus]|uniref:cache domain-containing sensor histidine kinase n=1 Tax=Paenibacillus lautus TaxID=1401 RepID=UPI001B207FB7|nr:sensor histidine kinase [Paenibacillus lautus]GIP06417.1 sensor histidine kinase YesM [Paenibacillus lautus]